MNDFIDIMTKIFTLFSTSRKNKIFKKFIRDYYSKSSVNRSIAYFEIRSYIEKNLSKDEIDFGMKDDNIYDFLNLRKYAGSKILFLKDKGRYERKSHAKKLYTLLFFISIALFIIAYLFVLNIFDIQSNIIRFITIAIMIIPFFVFPFSLLKLYQESCIKKLTNS